MFSDHARIIKNAHLRTCLEHRNTKATRMHLHFAAHSAWYRRDVSDEPCEWKSEREIYSGKTFRTATRTRQTKLRKTKMSSPINARNCSNQTRSKLQFVELCFFRIISLFDVRARELFFRERTSRDVSRKIRWLKMTGWSERKVFFTMKRWLSLINEQIQNASLCRNF